MTMKKIKAVLFDLDGTLVDTAKDFVRIIRDMATENGWQAPSDEEIREQVSAGAKAMVSLFSSAEFAAVGQDEDEVMDLRQVFLDRYEADICVDSAFFTGLEELLERLDEQGIAWGVVTNKPRFLAVKLLERLGLSERCGVLVCPEDVSNSKPDPEPIYLAMSSLDIESTECNAVIYIGDHIRDIQAGNAAGNITVLAGYGYISAEEKSSLATWQADYTVDTPEGLVELLQNNLLKSR